MAKGADQLPHRRHCCGVPWRRTGGLRRSAPAEFHRTPTTRARRDVAGQVPCRHKEHATTVRSPVARVRCPALRRPPPASSAWRRPCARPTRRASSPAHNPAFRLEDCSCSPSACAASVGVSAHPPGCGPAAPAASRPARRFKPVHLPRGGTSAAEPESGQRATGKSETNRPNSAVPLLNLLRRARHGRRGGSHRRRPGKVGKIVASPSSERTAVRDPRALLQSGCEDCRHDDRAGRRPETRSGQVREACA